MKNPLKVSYLTNSRYGKSVEQVTKMLNRFDPEINSKIEITIHSTYEIQFLTNLVKELVVGMEFYTDFINRDNTDENGANYDIGHKARTILEKHKEVLEKIKLMESE